MKGWILVAALLAVIGSLVGWRMSKREDASPKGGMRGGGRNSTPTVKLEPASSLRIVEALETVGTIESPNNVQLSPKVSGRIEAVLVREGDEVKAGQVLARIDPTEIESQVLQQQANVSEAQSRLAQAKFGQGPTEAGIKGAMRQQDAALESAKADLNQAERTYDAQVAASQASVTDAEAKIKAADANVRNAQAELTREEASLKNIKSKLASAEDLFSKGYIPRQQLDDARTAVEVQEGEVAVAEGRLEGAKSAVESAKAQRASAVQQLEITKRRGQADIQAAKARVIQAEASVEVAQANQSQNPAFRENIAALEASLRAAQAQLAQVRTRLEDTVIRAPIDGSITERNLDPGALASPGQPILELKSVDWVFANASVPIEQSGSVVKGRAAEVTFDSLPNRIFTGDVALVNAAADPESRQLRFSVRLENANGLIKPGMYARVRLLARATEADVTVSREAVTTKDGKSTVTVVDDKNIASVREVRLGATDGKRIQILEGVRAGEKVVVLSYSPVEDGQEVSTGEPREGRGQQRSKTK